MLTTTVDRRAFMRGGAAVAALAAGPNGRAMAAAPLFDAYLRARGFAGRPAYWVTQGLKYAMVGNRLLPFQRAAVLEAVRFDLRGDLLHSSTLEGSFNFGLDGASALLVENPLTKAPVVLTPGVPLIVDYEYAADGALGIAASSPIKGTARGRLSLEPGQGGPGVREAFEGFAPGGSAGDPTLTETIIFTPESTSASPAGFRRVAKSVIAVRNWPFDAPHGVAVRLLSSYQGTKFASVDAALSVIGPAVVESSYPDLAARLRAF